MEMINCSEIWHYFIIFTSTASSCLIFKREVLLIEHTVKLFFKWISIFRPVKVQADGIVCTLHFPF